MFIRFLFDLRAARVPVSLMEYLTLMQAMQANIAGYRVEDFYYLARSTLVKDEGHLDRFDRVFGTCFRGMIAEDGSGEEAVEPADLPAEWLRRLAETVLTPEDMARVEALGGFEKLMQTLRQRLAGQQGRHQGGSTWIGTAGTSPFGGYGYNPEGVRIGQQGSRHHRAVKLWDRRLFRNLDGDADLGSRTVKMALRRLRRFARTGAAGELDLDGTIGATARNAGLLDVKMRPERRNAAKLLLFFDVGGSMDPHIRRCEALFSAARGEFKHLEYYYFHNCPYDGLWRDNHRRHSDVTPTWDVLHTYPSDYRAVFVGDATMSPYEIEQPGGSVEYWNREPGRAWLERLLAAFPRAVWLNPQPGRVWDVYPSIGLIRAIMGNRMFPLTLAGLDEAMRTLSR